MNSANTVSSSAAVTSHDGAQYDAMATRATAARSDGSLRAFIVTRPACRPSSRSWTEYATSSAQSMTWASRHGRPGGAPSRIHSKTSASDS